MSTLALDACYEPVGTAYASEVQVAAMLQASSFGSTPWKILLLLMPVAQHCRRLRQWLSRPCSSGTLLYSQAVEPPWFRQNLTNILAQPDVRLTPQYFVNSLFKNLK